jgi:Beta-lactamase
MVRHGAEVGLQAAVMRHGRVVVDAVTGDAGRQCPVVPDTLFYVASAAKGVASAVAHVLIERGELPVPRSSSIRRSVRCSCLSSSTRATRATYRSGRSAIRGL